MLELEPEIPPRRIALAWHRDRHRSPAARAFVEVAAEVCADVAAVADAHARLAIASRAASNCSGTRRMYEWRQSELGKMPTSSAGIERSRSSSATSGRMPERPAPALTLRVLLRIGRHLDDGEDRLPDAGVADREITFRRRWAAASTSGARSVKPVCGSGRSPRPRTSSQRSLRRARRRRRSPGRSRCTCRRSRSAPRGARARSAASPSRAPRWRRADDRARCRRRSG